MLHMKFNPVISPSIPLSDFLYIYIYKLEITMRTRKDSDTSSHNRRKSFNPYWTSTSKTLPSSIGGGGRKLRRRHLLLPTFRLILRLTMAGQSRKWMILVATIWIQAFTGTNFDFSAYSSDLKSVLGITQVQLNYLATASDLGKALGWSSGLALLYLPLPVVMFIAAFMGFAGYGVQWLVIRGAITLPYFVVFLLCLLAGCSICWFNTVCFVLCIRNFPESRALAISLTVSFNGVSAALYALAVDSIDSRTIPLYLILNAVIPLLTSFVALVPILRQPSIDPLPPEAIQYDSIIFLFLNILAVITGFYLLFLGSTNDLLTTRLFFAGAIFLLVFPLFVPGIVYARDWFKRTIHSNIRLDGSGFILVDDADLELHKELINREGSSYASNAVSIVVKGSANNTDETTNGEMNPAGKGASFYRAGMMFGKDRLVMLGEEHSAAMLVRRFDFWLYYVAYFCGGTIGLVYSNNLGQIAQSLGRSSDTTTLITLYSSFSFFGRLLSAAPDYVRARIYFPRTGWVAVALTPTPVAFFLLAASGSSLALQTGTALIGLSSGFIFAAAVSITSELFGPNSVGVNHNMLITNIPLGSLVYGLLAAVVYDTNADYSGGIAMITDPVICMGRQCYFWTFVLWGSLSLVGLVSCALLFLRTRPAYYQFERDRISSQLDQRVL